MPSVFPWSFIRAVMRQKFTRWEAVQETAPSLLRRTIDYFSGRRDRGSGQDHVRHQLLAAGLRTDGQRQQQADQSADCADCHWDRKPQVPVDREISHDRTGEAAPDSPLVEAEPGRRRAHLGREALSEIGRRLAPDTATGKPSLQPKNTTIIA